MSTAPKVQRWVTVAGTGGGRAKVTAVLKRGNVTSRHTVDAYTVDQGEAVKRAVEEAQRQLDRIDKQLTLMQIEVS